MATRTPVSIRSLIPSSHLPSPQSRVPLALASGVARGLLACACATLLITGTASAQNALGTAPSAGAPDAQVVAPLLNASEVDVALLDFILPTDSADLLVEVSIAGQPYTLELTPYSLRGEEFRVLVDDGSGVLSEVAPPPIRTRRGTVLEIPGSEVRAHFDGWSLSAQITTPTGTIGIQPVADVIPGTDPAWHAIYDARNLLPVNGVCGTTGSGGSVGGTTVGGTQPLGGGGITYNQTDIAVDCDFEFFQDNNSSIDATVDEVEQILNGAESAYDDAPLLIVYELTTVVVRTSAADPYGSISNPGTLLNTFESVWNSGAEDGIQRDVAHLFTGVNLDGTVIGIANLNDICTSFSYGLSWASFTSNNTNLYALIAHELGHNWSATHCDGDGSGCKIMCATLGGCNGVNPLAFSPTPSGQIQSYRNSRTCLSLRQPPQSVPFLDSFPTTAISSALWSYGRGAIVSSQGVGEPSGNLSLNLDSNGSGTYADDEIRSNEILLAGVADPHASFYTQHRGVEAGETLVVEYQDASLDWVILDTFVSTGTDQTSFVFHEYDLPTNGPDNASHNAFRIRFRTEVNGGNDDWYIDDVRVGSGPVTPPAPPTVAAIIPNNGSVLGGTPVTILGADFQTNAAVTIGAALLQNTVVVDSATITGVIPAGASTGPVNVVVSQSSGADTLNNAFTYTQNLVRHDDGMGAPGGNTVVAVLADHDDVISGYSIAVEFDPSLIQFVSVTDAGTDAAGAEFFQPGFDNSPGVGGGWWTLGVVLSFTGGLTLLPAPDSTLALVEYQVAAGLPLGLPIPVTPVNGAGVPPTENVLVDVGGSALATILEGGTIITSGTLFIRGDVNDDGALNIADPIAILDYLFNQGPGECLDALDGNDDGSLNIADAIFLLDFLFNSGSEPPAPHPNPGTDPTADPLDC